MPCYDPFPNAIPESISERIVMIMTANAMRAVMRIGQTLCIYLLAGLVGAVADFAAFIAATLACRATTLEWKAALALELALVLVSTACTLAFSSASRVAEIGVGWVLGVVMV